MPEHLITCINKRGGHLNPHERIEYIGQRNNWKLSENSAISRIKSKTDSFYTLVKNKRAEIIVASRNGREYLKTTADGLNQDNLLSLDECVNCRVI